MERRIASRARADKGQLETSAPIPQHYRSAYLLILVAIIATLCGCRTLTVSNEVQPQSYYDLIGRWDCQKDSAQISYECSPAIAAPKANDEGKDETSKKHQTSDQTNKEAVVEKARNSTEPKPPFRSEPQKALSSKYDKFVQKTLSPHSRRTLFKLSEAAKRSQDAPTDHDKARDYLDLGMAFSSELCSRFMNEATQQRQDRHFGRDFASNLNTGISAVLNLTKSTNLATGSVSAVFGALDSSFQSWDKHYVAAVDLPTAEALMRKAMAELASGNLATAGLSFSQAEIRLQEYTNTCSFNGIKRLVNESVSKAAQLGIQTKQGIASIGYGPNTAPLVGDRHAAFHALGRCEWSKAAQAFASVDAGRFGSDYRYSNTLKLKPSAAEVKSLSAQVDASDAIPSGVIAEMEKCDPPKKM